MTTVGSRGAEDGYLSKLRRLLVKMEPDNQELLLHMAQERRQRLATNVLLTDFAKRSTNSYCVPPGVLDLALIWVYPWRASPSEEPHAPSNRADVRNRVLLLRL